MTMRFVYDIKFFEIKRDQCNFTLTPLVSDRQR